MLPSSRVDQTKSVGEREKEDIHRARRRFSLTSIPNSHSEDAKKNFFYKIPNTNNHSTERISIARTPLNHTKLIGCLQRSLRVYLENKRGESKSKITLRKAAASVIDPPSPTLREKNEKNSDD